MSITIIQKLIICASSLFFMILTGAFLKKRKMVGEEFGKDISNMILYVAQPFLIVTAYIRPYDKHILSSAAWVFIFAVIAHSLFALLSLLFFRKAEPKKRTVLRFSMIFANTGYMGIPLISYTLGEHAVIYASVYVMVFNLFSWTLGFFMYSKDRRCISLKSAFLNPTSIATYAGLLIFFLNAHRFFPTDGVFYQSFNMLKNLVPPLSMIVVGYRLIDALHSKKIIDFNLIKGVFLRLIFVPAIFFLILFFAFKTNICTNITAISVSLFCAITPSATITSMLAEKFDGDSVYASMVVSISTILSIVTMPLMSLLLYLL